jgi:hypothetical protein
MALRVCCSRLFCVLVVCPWSDVVFVLCDTESLITGEDRVLVQTACSKRLQDKDVKSTHINNTVYCTYRTVKDSQHSTEINCGRQRLSKPLKVHGVYTTGPFGTRSYDDVR